MTAGGGAPGLDKAALAAPDPLVHCLEAALEIADAADVLGVPSELLRTAHADGARRRGFPGDVYVLALVGGTGVGKSSLLNAIAGGVVSPASVRRPTTALPVAWVPRSQREALAALLDWLGVTDVHEHDATDLGPVAILDLPDIDSIQADHRRRVETLLPRVDAVAWVTDPEKYADAVLHDEFVRAWLPRLDRQVVVLNKADRVTDEDARRIRRDIVADIAGETPSSRPRGVDVLLSSATRDHGLDDLRAWVAAGVDAKGVIRARIAASLLNGTRDVARAAGLASNDPATPFLDEGARAQAIRSATDAVLRTVDLEGLKAQSVAATRASARSRGTGPLGRLTSFLYRASGREGSVANPAGFLLRWRDRGTIGPAVEAIRGALADSLRAASPAVRPTLAGVLEPAAIRRGLELAIERAIGGVGALEPPSSRWWSVIGLAQTLATAGVALSAAWVLVWILARPVTGSVDLPVVGPIPSPFASLIAFVLAGYVLARLLGTHAGWVGSRWADRVRGRVASAVETEIRERVFEPLDRLEDARRRLTSAATLVERTCGPGTPGTG